MVGSTLSIFASVLSDKVNSWRHGVLLVFVSL